MNSNLLVSIHIVSVMLFLVTYIIKTALLFSSKRLLDKYSHATRIPEMIISTAFLVTGIWLFVILGGIKILLIIKLVCVFTAIPLAVVGFKKYKKGLALLSLILIIAAYGLSEASQEKPFIPAKVQVTNENAGIYADGAKVYHANCTFCHGTDGTKMYRNAADLSHSTLNNESIRLAVSEGSKNKMPAYKDVLSDSEIASLATYVQTLRGANSK